MIGLDFNEAKIFIESIDILIIAQSVGAVEYTDCIRLRPTSVLDMIFVSASHQTGLDTSSVTWRSA